MRTLEIKSKDADMDKQRSWLDDHSISFVIKNIGAAFPLGFGKNPNPELPYVKAHDHVPVRAFLFSVKSLVFGTERGGNGQATMHGFSFQFVHR
jgi:hypothetical protein